MYIQLDDIIHTLRITLRDLKDLRDKAAPPSQVERPLDLWLDLACTKITSFSNILCSAQLALASDADPAAVRQALLQHMRDGVQVEASLMHSLMRAADPAARAKAGTSARGATSSCAGEEAASGRQPADERSGGSRTPAQGSTSAEDLS
ncbi:hypothetical protein [Nannocystis pusilla]|uniref:Uncharacterized protein n=1 Tax=Nannocystis pusilla TaxID=889268 RepID=A0ABS7TMB4_9BACT|nr:hypothetical protein [Nannocystis pusilla]MBZ5709277.1 hypothetical protein [Nannocystis pusilla]